MAKKIKPEGFSPVLFHRNRSSNANDSGYVAFENQQSDKHVIPVHRVWRKPDLLGLYGQVNKRIR
jgi:hypothetical protein